MLNALNEKFSHTREGREKAIFSTLFIAGNRLQTLFDSHIPEVSLKQFMLLSLVRQSEERLSLTQMGSLLGCSRQNIKKLAGVLEKKGFITLQQSPDDTWALHICPTGRMEAYFQNGFDHGPKELQALFDIYSDEEVRQLFCLLSKLYTGIERLEKRAVGREAGPQPP